MNEPRYQNREPPSPLVTGRKPTKATPQPSADELPRAIPTPSAGASMASEPSAPEARAEASPPVNPILAVVAEPAPSAPSAPTTAPSVPTAGEALPAAVEARPTLPTATEPSPAAPLVEGIIESRPSAPPPEPLPPRIVPGVELAPTRPLPAATPTVQASRPVSPPPKATTPDPPVLPPLAEPVQPYHYMLLALIAVLALALRLRDPMSSMIIGAEDPYLHMERTWDIAQGDWSVKYPPGLMILMLPFALLGPDAFYWAARFLPTLLGPVAVVGMFLLVKRYVGPVGALASATFVAVAPELVRRTNLLFPTALDLAIIPFLLLAVIQLTEQKGKGLVAAGALSGAMLLVHPWAILLLMPPIGSFWLITVVVKQHQRGWAPWAVGGGFVATMGALALLPIWDQSNLLLDRAMPRFFEVLKAPSIVASPPLFVDLPAQLTWTAILLAAAGAVIAIRRRDKFSILALLWTGLMLPLTLVDWFGLWYLPHRTVAYLGIGVAMLVALPMAEIYRTVVAAKPKTAIATSVGVVAALLILTLPSALAASPWYRVYDQDDLNAWGDLDEMDASYVVAGSWQARAGYRAYTAREAVFYPAFFEDEVVREFEEQQHPGLIVVVDRYTVEAGVPTEFLQSWTLIGQWGDVSAYRHNPM